MPKTATPSIAGTPSAGQQLVVVAIDDLQVDHSYHRPSDPRWVARKAKVLDPNMYQAPTVCERPAGMFVVDGHGVLELAKAAGHTYAYVRVLDGLSYDEEVRLYLDLNGNHRPLTALEKHRALVILGDPIALAIERVLDARGLTVSSTSGKLNITAIATLRYAWGSAGTARDRRVVSGHALANGEQVLQWALDSLSPLLNKGESASLVYSKLNLNALIWLRRNAESVPDARTMARALSGASVYSLRKALEDFDRSKRARNGIRLARVLNAGAGAPVVVLPQHGDSPEGDED